MSKTALKKELSNLSKEQLVEQILDLYDKNKSVKEFYNFYLNPRNEKDLAAKYKKIIRKEFNVENPMRGTEKFSVAKRAVSDFKDLQPSPEALADVMLYLPESACELTYCYGDFSEQFYNAAYNNFKAALEFMYKHNLLDKFKLRAEQCVKWASPCGYGFAGEIADAYHEYYQK
jgi:AICAR transformylase/IMP cyclohydrolase PurH